MDQEDLVQLLTDFICEQGQWNNFLEFAEKKGYSSDDIDDAS
jgi:hypothetical protein